MIGDRLLEFLDQSPRHRMALHLRSLLLSSLVVRSLALVLRGIQSIQLPRSNANMPPMGNKVLETLDPCVVLMKEMIAEYEAEWKDKEGIFILAQGVVCWEPPDSVVAPALQTGIQTNTLHLLPRRGAT
jgi:hypothetical protein